MFFVVAFVVFTVPFRTLRRPRAAAAAAQKVVSQTEYRLNDPSSLFPLDVQTHRDDLQRNERRRRRRRVNIRRPSLRSGFGRRRASTCVVKVETKNCFFRRRRRHGWPHVFVVLVKGAQLFVCVYSVI